MAKKHKNLDNILIQWDGDLSKPSDGSAQSSPDSVDLGVWGGTYSINDCDYCLPEYASNYNCDDLNVIDVFNKLLS